MRNAEEKKIASLTSAPELYNLIKSEFKANDSPTDLIEKAYQFASNKHSGQFRKNGLPYIIHPVAVALILAKLGFDENVVSAALLHDVIEDCGVELKEIEETFNLSVAEMVDCVSAIDQEKYVFNKDNIYEDENFEKASIEEQSFKKLIAIGKKNPLGFCIKFADRLNNLRTIESFPYNKQLEKVKETEKWIIPIAKILNAEYFYRAIKNECFKIKHKFDGVNFFYQYENYHHINTQNIENLTHKLQEAFANTCINLIKIKEVREYKVFEDLSKLIKTTDITKISQGQILKVTNYNIYLLYDRGNYKEVISDALNILNKKLGNNMKIIDAKMGNFTNKPFYQLEDKYRNKYNLYVMSLMDYTILRNGTMDGQDYNFLDEDDYDILKEELIRVKTRSGEIKYIPKGSTALDFAFKIHRDIGFGFIYAIINGSKTKSPAYTKIYDGDQVEVIVEKNENGEISNKAELKWLAYVNSEFAKKNLIRYFERKIIK